MYSQALLAALALSAVSSAGASNVSVDVPVLEPTNTLPLASTLLSFSIEQDKWPDWSGIDERNEFTYSALTTYANLTGQPPKIRVGADSEDHTVWSPTVTVCYGAVYDIVYSTSWQINEDVFPPANSVTPYPEASNITVGNEYYTLSKWLPSGMYYTKHSPTFHLNRRPQALTWSGE